MTTPERLRRRQLIEGAMLIMIGLLMLAQTWYLGTQDAKQRECLASNFSKLSSTLEIRSGIAERETEASRNVNLAELQVETEEEFLARLRAYEQEINAIEQDRKDNPVPPYPAGVCR